MNITNLENRIMRKFAEEERARGKLNYLSDYAAGIVTGIEACRRIVIDCFYDEICGKENGNDRLEKPDGESGSEVREP